MRFARFGSVGIVRNARARIAAVLAGGLVLLGLGLLVGLGASAMENFYPPQDQTWAMPKADLFAVAIEGERALAVGYWGTILLSTDRGQTWRYRPTPTSRTLFGVDFAGPDDAWAVGDAGVVLRSRDGGETWEQVRVEVEDQFGGRGDLEAVLFDVSAISGDDVWASGDFGALIHTRDGGETWDRPFLTEEVFGDGYLADRLLNAIEFQDRERGWIAGEFGTALRTEDGGETWGNRASIEGAISDIYLFGLGVNGELDALAGGVGGVAVVSHDGGHHWQAVQVPTTAGLFGAAAHGGRGLLVGDRGEVVATRDAGRTWFKPKRPKLFNWLQGAAFGDDGLALVVGEKSLILRSLDGGDSFEKALGAEPGPVAAISVPESGPSPQPGRADATATRGAGH